jgi:hypothetical protein
VAPSIGEPPPVVYYVVPDHCTTEHGSGTQSDPYCLLQSAVDAAVPDSSIVIYQNSTEDLEFNESVVISGKSNLSIEGLDNAGDAAPKGMPALSIENSSNINISGLVLESNGNDALDVNNSDGVYLSGDSMLVEGGTPEGSNAMTVSGTSSNLGIERDTFGDIGGRADVVLGPGVSQSVFSLDVMSGSQYGFVAESVDHLDVVENTIDRGCLGAVFVSGSPTAVSVEDNVFEAGSVTAADCSAAGLPYSPVVSVDSTSAAATTSDYNDFDFSADGTEAYQWAGTTYPTLAAFQAAVSQGAHDAVDPTVDAKMFLSPDGNDASGTPMTADAVPLSTSPSIGTADASAPGYVGYDLYGRAYDDRGALKYAAPSLAPQLPVFQIGARTVQAYASANPPASTENYQYVLYSFNWGDGTPSSGPAVTSDAGHTYANPGTYTASVTVTDVFGDTAKATYSVQTNGTDFTPVGPARILDTRDGTGTGGEIAKVGPGQTLVFKVAGVGPIPAGATAIALNLTATNPTSNGFLTAYGDGNGLPNVSNVNYAKGGTVADDAIVPIGTDGEVDITNTSTGSLDIVADTSGYFAPAQADGYAPVTPYRLLDTRTGTGGHNAPLTSADPVRLKVAGVGGVPAEATAVAVNLTVASPTNPGYIRAYADGSAMPSVSNLNFAPGQAIANAAIVPVGKDGYIDIVLPTAGSARMIVDVDGYFSTNTTEAASSYVPQTPTRDLDTRTLSTGAIQAGSYYSLPLGAKTSLAPSITGVVLNATVTQPAAGGDLVVFPDNKSSSGSLVIPTSSSLNFTAGATVPNLVFAAPGTDANVDFLNQSAGSIQLVVDVFGLFESQ